MRYSTLSLPLFAVAASAAGSKKPLVNELKLQKDINIKDLIAGAQKLQDFADANGKTRVFGGAGHNATVDYLYKTLKSLNYYNVVKQPFTELYSAGTADLKVAGDEIEATIMTYTPAGEASGPLVKVANLGCEAGDFPAESDGKVVLIQRGECPFAQKSTNAKAAGATAAIVYNNVPGELSGTLGEPFADYAPIVGISQEDGQAILAKLEAGDVEVDIKVDATTEDRVTYNVIAETKEGDHDNVLVLGGHSDSVAAGPGINDDGSGIIGILNVAKALTKYRVKNAVRFGFWSAEEFGLLGSYHYIKSINSSETEVAKIRAYLNFDMIASPNYVYGIYDGDGSAFNLTGPAGSDTIEKDFERFFKTKRLASVPSEFSGRSDYAAFIENGIPSGGLFTGAEEIKTEEEAKKFGGEAGVAYDINYHKAGDDINNLNKEAFLVNTQAIAYSVAKYAKSWKGLPKVNHNTRRWDADRAQIFKRSSAHTHAHGGPCGTVEQ
ncbi:Leucyl aminopeptidase yscIV [Fusarium torreyae]|uniref:Peptide hydrolase n=1 Tax=Fusarium torreyae TaxID=1237075 RepID=A0A9W8VAU2_9HYPO|nr:Leucyl aminopeptidase yscIV [Fusarium torreyae]